MSGDFDIPKSVLVVAAHPDDAEFGCGATMAKWIKRGTTVSYLIATNGDKGDDGGKYTVAELARVRHDEQLSAAKVLGVDKVVMLNNADGSLTYTLELREQVVRWIKRIRPEAVFTHDPSSLILNYGGVNHADHRAIGQAAIDAVYPFSRGIHQYPQHKDEDLQPHTVRHLFLWDCNEPNYIEDAGETAELKLQAILAHASQFSDSAGARKFVFEHLERAGKASGKNLAEAFRHVAFG